MFLPIRDDNPHTVTPFVNYTMLAICIVVYVWQFSLGAQAEKVGSLAELEPALARARAARRTAVV